MLFAGKKGNIYGNYGNILYTYNGIFFDAYSIDLYNKNCY